MPGITALLCMGEAEAAKIAEAEHLKVLLIYQEGQTLKEHMSSAFIIGQEDKGPALYREVMQN